MTHENLHKCALPTFCIIWVLIAFNPSVESFVVKLGSNGIHPKWNFQSISSNTNRLTPRISNNGPSILFSATDINYERISDKMDENESEDELISNRNLRFSGVGRLYTSSANATHDSENQQPPHIGIIERLAASTVAVVGLGGVGSWAAEALCRSGVGNIVLIDMDDICISNTNRQLHTLSSTVGKSKIHQMQQRLLDINPQCNVTTIFDFVSVDNVDSILGDLELSVCLDAIDGQNEKTALIAACASRAIPIVTCGGAAGRSDPTQIVCDDLTKAKEDRLLFWCRKQLRKYHGFPKGPKNGITNNHRVKKWNILAVFSMELQKDVKEDTEKQLGSMRTCDGALGTACFLTGTYGFVAASRVVDMIATNNYVVPVAPFELLSQTNQSKK